MRIAPPDAAAQRERHRAAFDVERLVILQDAQGFGVFAAFEQRLGEILAVADAVRIGGVPTNDGQRHLGARRAVQRAHAFPRLEIVGARRRHGAEDIARRGGVARGERRPAGKREAVELALLAERAVELRER